MVRGTEAFVAKIRLTRFSQFLWSLVQRPDNHNAEFWIIFIKPEILICHKKNIEQLMRYIHCRSNHWNIFPSFYSLFRLSSTKISTLHNWALVKGTSDRWIPHAEIPVMRKALPYLSTDDLIARAVSNVFHDVQLILGISLLVVTYSGCSFVSQLSVVSTPCNSSQMWTITDLKFAHNIL